MFKFTYIDFKKITADIQQKHISAFAAQVSFYFIMSLFPMMTLVFSMLDSLKTNIPGLQIDTGIEIAVLYDSVSKIPIISFSTLLAAWSSGKTFGALKDGFQYILSDCTKTGYIRKRIGGIIISVIFSVIVSLIVIISIYGTMIIDFVFSEYRQYAQYFSIVKLIKKIFVIISLFLITFLTYRLLPDWNTDEKNIPKNKKIIFVSAVVSAVIYTYTVFFSLYIVEYSNVNIIYNNMTSLVSFMILTYGIVYVFILGFRVLVYKNNDYLCTDSNL